MDKRIINFFIHSCAEVSAKDILDHSPVDPGYYDYVRELEAIRELCNVDKVPACPEFDLSEAINLTRWGDHKHYIKIKEKFPDALESFKRFRRFTGSISLVILHKKKCDFDIFGDPNYTLCNLLLDRDQDSKASLKLQLEAVYATRELLLVYHDYDEEDPPYPDDNLLLASVSMLLLAQYIGDWELSEKYATQLIADNIIYSEEFYSSAHDEDLELDDYFVFGTNGSSDFQPKRKNWIELFLTLRNPTNHLDTEKIIKALQPMMKK